MSKRVSAAAPIFAALGDKTRLSLVERLASGGALSITELTEGTDITRQAITRHLDVLSDAGLVSALRDGRERRFELRLKQVVQAQRYLDQISADWDAALSRLRDLVE